MDVEDLVLNAYTSFDPDQAVGVQLDQRCAINGIQRQGGTYSTTDITLVVTQSVNLYGLDQTTQPVYTVADQVGNQWELMTSQVGLAAGTYSLMFQAANPGQVITTPNTITVAVTVVLGVSSINNPNAQLTTGTAQESDGALRIRRQQSVALPSQGYYAGLLAALENITGVTSAFVYENDTGTTDGNDVPGHSIWVIVAGSGAAASIANAIYTKRNAGCGMKGSISYTITQVDGSPFIVYWDDVVSENLFITFTATPINSAQVSQYANILSGLVTNLVPGVYSQVNINEIAAQVLAIDPNTLVTGAGVSSALIQTLSLSGVAASGTFKILYNGNASASINWNDSISTINTKVNAVTGLSSCVVTGSLSSESLVFTLTGSALGLITVENNTLMTSAPAAITFSYNEGYGNVATPALKNNQFVLAQTQIVIVPILISPASASVAPSGTQAFSALGGYGAYTWAITINNSGGSINSGSGLYTAGTTPNVSDTISVTDSLGNVSTAVVSVT